MLGLLVAQLFPQPQDPTNIIKIPIFCLNATQNWKKDWVPFGITNSPETTNQNLQTIGCSAGIPAENCEFIDFLESLLNNNCLN